MAHSRTAYIALSLAALVVASPALAEPTIWREVGGWDISYYPSQEGCIAMTEFEDGTFFFIGYDFSITEPTLDVILMDDRWQSIEADKEYSVQLFFGDEAPWSITMNGQDFDGTPGLSAYQSAYGDQADLFIAEFQRELTMDWQFQGRSLGQFSLRGSRQAMDEVQACQNSYLEARDADGTDPFATNASAAATEDPFAL